MTTAEKAKDKRLQAIYKTTLTEQNKKLEEQKWKCPICDRPFTGLEKYTAYQDHDHRCCARRKKTFCGKCNRGLLCYICNKWVIGLIEKMRGMETYPPDFTRALAYIEQWTGVIQAKGGYAKEETKRGSKTRGPKVLQKREGTSERTPTTH